MVAENSLVAIRTATNMCFGVVIASRFVLFAADCVSDEDIQLDDLNLSAGRENIEALAIHKSPQHPIAMIQLKNDRDISMCIEPRTVFKFETKLYSASDSTENQITLWYLDSI